MSKKFFALALLFTTLTVPAFAGPNPTHIPNHPRVDEVNRRISDQRQRIVRGDESGALNGREQRQLSSEYRHIKAEEHAMRAADGGHLTRQDQRILNRQLDRRSAEIYRDKHN